MYEVVKIIPDFFRFRRRVPPAFLKVNHINKPAETASGKWWDLFKFSRRVPPAFLNVNHINKPAETAPGGSKMSIVQHALIQPLSEIFLSIIILSSIRLSSVLPPNSFIINTPPGYH